MPPAVASTTQPTSSLRAEVSHFFPIPALPAPRVEVFPTQRAPSARGRRAAPARALRAPAAEHNAAAIGGTPLPSEGGRSIHASDCRDIDIDDSGGILAPG